MSEIDITNNIWNCHRSFSCFFSRVCVCCHYIERRLIKLGQPAVGARGELIVNWLKNERFSSQLTGELSTGCEWIKCCGAASGHATHLFFLWRVLQSLFKNQRTKSNTAAKRHLKADESFAIKSEKCNRKDSVAWKWKNCVNKIQVKGNKLNKISANKHYRKSIRTWKF